MQVNDLVGERTVPDLWHENYWFRRHERAYRELGPIVTAAAGSEGIVAEAGCGEGYGVLSLREAGARRLLAFDYDAATVAHATQRYAAALPGTATARANLTALPLADDSVAVVVCLQVIEHLWTPWEFLAECARVLRPGGLLAVSTPNRVTFSPGLRRNGRPPNPFHAKEYDVDELTATVAAHLDIDSVLGVVAGPRLRAWEAAHGNLMAAQLAAPPQQWDQDLVDAVRSVTAADFALLSLGDAESANVPVLDLLVLARRQKP